MTTFYLGDCLDVMKDLSDGVIDCFVCDLPYGQLSQEKGATPFGRNVKGPSDSGCSWDIKIDLNQFWEQVKRLARNEHVPVLMFCNTKFGIDLINSNPDWFRYDLVWNKGHGVSFLLANKMPMKSHEMIYVFSKHGAFYNRIDVETDKKEWKRLGKGANRTAVQYSIKQTNEAPREGGQNGMRCVLSVINVKGKKTAGNHPTEKPEDLYEWLLKRYVSEGGTILDPTAGSFNSCFVADRLGMKAIGIEKDEMFFERAVKRLNG